MDQLEVHFTMPERYLALLRRGSEVAVATLAYPGESVRGRVDVVDPVVNPQTRSLRVIAKVPNTGGRLRAGMSADVRLTLSSRDSALTVPAEAVFAEGTDFLVYKVGADGSVERTPITLGTRLADVVEVTAGLVAGDVVVRAGQQKLYPGAKVMPAGADPPPGSPEPGAAAAAPADSAVAGESTP
jgi:RND family efflux transporter MFP subunit